MILSFSDDEEDIYNWEHCSFKEQGIDREPTIHIGAVANALERNSITTFAQLEKFKTDKGKEFDSREQFFIPKWKRLERLKELAKAYADYEPYKAVHDMRRLLSGGRKKFNVNFIVNTNIFLYN